MFDQFGGPITLPEIAPPENTTEPVTDPLAQPTTPTTTIPPSPEVLAERRRLANIDVGRLGLVAVSQSGTVFAADIWMGKLGVVQDGIFVPKERVPSQPIGLAVSGSTDQNGVMAVTTRNQLHAFSGDLLGSKARTSTVTSSVGSSGDTSIDSSSDSSSDIRNSRASFGGIVVTGDGTFAVLAQKSFTPTEGFFGVSPGVQRTSKTLAPTTDVSLSGPESLGPLGALPTGEFVQFRLGPSRQWFR